MSSVQLNNLISEFKDKQMEEKKEIADPNGNFKSGKFAGKGRVSRRGRNVNDDRRLAWEAEQAKKLVIEKDVKGKVKWYSVRYHYGFIARDDEKENDVFVHQTAIAKSRIVKYYLRTLGDGEEVVFDIVQGKQGPEAANVTGPNGTEVRGSRFHNRQFYTYRRRFGYNRERHSQERGYRTPPENGVEPGRRRRSAQSEHKIPTENVGKEIDDVKKGNTERKRHVRNFRARRHPLKKGIEGKEVEGGAGDGNKENFLSELENETHTEGRGDGCFHDEKADQYRSSAAKMNLGKLVDPRGATEAADMKAIEKLSSTDNN